MDPSAFSLSLKTHLQAIGFRSCGASTIDHVSFFMKELYSCWTTPNYLVKSSSCLASSRFLGSEFISPCNQGLNKC
jgi:hypothetical protein